MPRVKLIEVEDKVLQLAAESYDRTEEKLNEEVAQLREWMKKQPHLPEVMSDKVLQNIYIGSKCKMEKAKQKIDMYYTMRTKKTHIFNESNPKLASMKLFMEAFYATMLPKMIDDMYRVLVIKVRNQDLVSDMDPYCLLRHMINVQEIRNNEDVVFGDVCIFDFENISLRFLIRFSPVVMFNYVKLYERSFSSCLKAVYFLHAPFYVDKLLALAKLVMKPKLFERIHTCADVDAVLEQFPKKILPQDYGGEGKSLEELREMLIAKFDEYQERFDQLDQLRVDETLRPVKKR